MKYTGRCSTFGGPTDDGMSKDTGLSLYESWEADQRPDLFLPRNPQKDVPTWARLKIEASYIALIFDREYAHKNRKLVQGMKWLVTNPKNDKSEIAVLVDNGPSWEEKRICDLSPGLARRLGLDTDDVVEVELLSC